MKKIIKSTSIILFSSLLMNTSIPTVLADQTNHSHFNHLTSASKSINVSDLEGNISVPKIDPSMLNSAKQLEDYFYIKHDGSIGLKGNFKEVARLLKISEKDAKLYFEAVNDLPNTFYKGAVGLRFNLGPKVRGMSGWAAGTFAAGYAGWYLKQFAVNPATAGFAALISGAIGWSVKTAVENHRSTTLAVVYIPGVELVYTVNVP
ncbi:hypothetical protein N1495_09605 [Streptococcus didelphis]|uniref:Secreted protein n=1 Tax=Streptococcus didelphis TaxID=102886 RepID=A0ABY9LFC4_9STRE|nr:hypothetical protein [Streptococcus didelphis]WMB27607.1 hypothetical protein N1496_05340 [Streptococcus didelphis]WMB29500.1 hypothetical protein N1495_09605 [Streptococcus didelphis]